MVSSATLKELQSYVLQFQIRIANGENRAHIKKEFHARLSAEGKTDLADLLLVVEAVLGERQMPNAQHINIYGGTFANLNFGEQIGTIHASAQKIEQSRPDGKPFAQALRDISKAVEQSSDLKDAEKKEALDAIELLGTQAELPAEKRKHGLIKASLAYLPGILATTHSVAQVWKDVEGIIGPLLRN